MTIHVRRNVCALILMFMSITAFPQVGFNNPNPDESSILDLTAVNKGLLIPRLTKPQREAISSPGRSLLAFDTTDGKFYFYDGGQWYSLNEWVQTDDSPDVSVAGNATVGGSVTANGPISANGTITATGTVTAPNYALNANGHGPVPAGGIIMWSGALNAIPIGWALCDGTNSTPDLRERFIVGAGLTDNALVTNSSAYAPGPGGHTNNNIVIAPANLPAHQHTFLDDYHFNNGLPDIMPGTIQTAAGNSYGGDSGSDTNNDTFFGRSKNTGNGPGTAAAIDNRPPYFALAFIMKLP